MLDLRLADGIGLDLVHLVREIRPAVRIVIVTGAGNVATAVAAIEAVSIDCLVTPLDADDVIAALLKSGDGLRPLAEDPI